MNKKEFAKQFAEKYEVTQEVARQMCYSVFETLSELLNKGENIYIYNLGSFKHEIRKEKAVRHPKTGEMMVIPERDIVVFKRSSNTKDNDIDDAEE